MSSRPVRSKRIAYCGACVSGAALNCRTFHVVLVLLIPMMSLQGQQPLRRMQDTHVTTERSFVQGKDGQNVILITHLRLMFGLRTPVAYIFAPYTPSQQLQ